MANISAELAAIMAAVFGRDVRQSIHDAIDKVNKTSEVCISAGTAVTGPTSSSTGFYERSLYININTWQMWKCTGVDTWQLLGSFKGDDGKGIDEITGPTTVGLVDTYTIVYTDGTTDTFDVHNGADGTDGADGANGSKWYKGTALTGTGSSIVGFPGNKDDYYLNSTTGYVYCCTQTGGPSNPGAALWDYVMTLSGGGGGSSVTVVDNLNSTSPTDALSANQGRVLDLKKQEKFNSYSAGLKETNPTPTTIQLSLDLLAGSNISLKEKNGAMEISSTGGSGGSSTFAGLDDTEITNPQPDEIVQYKALGGVMKLKNVPMPQGGHTMLPTPSASLTENDVVTAVNAATGTNENVPSLFSIQKWSNVYERSIEYTGTVNATGIGTWQDDISSATQADEVSWGWWYNAAFKIPDNADNIKLDISYDPATNEAITLGGWELDTTTGYLCIKFGNEIQDTTNAKVFVDLTYQR